MQEEEAIDRFKRRDEGIDKLLEEVINIDAEIKRQLKAGNEMIDETTKKIQQNTRKAEQVQVQIDQGTAELKEVLANVRGAYLVSQAE